MIALIDMFQPLSHSPEPIARPSSVVEQVRKRLQDSPYPSHRRLHCSFRDGVLTLHGRVTSYYLRQTARALLADLAGVEEFVDRLTVGDR